MSSGNLLESNQSDHDFGKLGEKSVSTFVCHMHERFRGSWDMMAEAETNLQHIVHVFYALNACENDDESALKCTAFLKAC